MATQEIHTDALVELYSMAKLYADENGHVTERQRYAINEAESIIENNSGYEVTDPFDG